MAPWEKYGGAPAPAPAPQPPTAPGVIMGRPKAGPTPYQQGRDQVSDSQKARDDARADEAAARSAAAEARAAEEFRRKMAAGPAGDASEGERKASGFYKRGQNAERNYRSIDFDPDQPGRQAVPPRSYIGQKLANNAPDILNTLPSAMGNSDERQLADQAQREFIAAVLRYDSGAAIPDGEFVTNAKIYFPQPGDSPAVIEQKAQARRVALEGLRDASGRLGSELNLKVPDGQQSGQQLGGYAGAALSVAAGGGDPADPEAIARQAAKDYRPDIGEVALGMDLPGSQSSDVLGGRISPQNEAAWAAFVKASNGDPSFSEAKANAFLQSLGEKGSLSFSPEFIDAVRKGEGGYSTGIDYQSADQKRESEMRSLAQERYGDDPTTRASSLLKGATLNLSDEAAGIAGGIADTLTGGSFAEGYSRERDLERYVQKGSRDKYGIGYELAGGLLTPLGIAKRPATALEFAKDGAKLGAVAGFGEGEGLANSSVNALIGAGTGYVLGGAIGKGANAVKARVGTKVSRQTERNALLQDFTDQGVTPLPANVGGAPTKVATAGAGQAFLSSGAIRDAAANQADEFGAAVARNAADAGAVLPIDEAGMLGRQAGERFSKETSKRGSALYERAYSEAGDVKIVPQSAISEIDSKIARLAQSPDPEAAALAKELGTLRQKLEDGVSVVGLRDARTRLSEGTYGGKLRSSADQQIYRDVLAKVSTDIEQGLRGAGKDRAANMFKTADKYWSERVEYIDNVLEPIIGKSRSGEDILKSIESMAAGNKGGVRRLGGLMKSLSDEERGNVQATLIDRLGKATKGQQSAEGDAFSASTFLTNWNGLSQKGKAALFGNSDLRQSLDQLARVAGSIKEAGKYTNTSNTAGALGWQAAISGATGSAVSWPAAVLAGGGQFLTGKLLAWPKFAAWLARAPKNPTPAAAKTYLGKLRGMAAAEPTVAGDLTRFLNAANDVSPARAAAQGQNENN